MSSISIVAMLVALVSSVQSLRGGGLEAHPMWLTVAMASFAIAIAVFAARGIGGSSGSRWPVGKVWVGVLAAIVLAPLALIAVTFVAVFSIVPALSLWPMLVFSEGHELRAAHPSPNAPPRRAASPA